jgi:peptidoglycan hydrolase-like protein with peptidoglycan-binding domain
MPCSKKEIIFGLSVFLLVALSPLAVEAASLSFSPSNGNYKVGEVFNVDIILDTEGSDTYGVGIRYLHYNPALLELQDASSASGTQIKPGVLYSRTLINSADTAQGKVEFVQLTSDGQVYSGSGVLATLTFRAKAQGTAKIYFDFTPSSTLDTNVADGAGHDILSSVSEGKYIIGEGDITPPVITDVTVENIQEHSAVITWNTDEPATSQLEFGLTSQYGNFTALGTALATAHSVSLLGLSSNTTFHFRVRSKDAAGNEAISLDHSFTTLGGSPDNIPPAVIDDLTVFNRTDSSITLHWTAPGDDDNVGIASAYDLRYSTSPITPDNWQDAFQVNGEPAPKISGSPESFTVTGLEPETTYYFAIKSSDEASNTSGLSNVVSSTTLSSQQLYNGMTRAERIAWLKKKIKQIKQLIANLRILLAALLNQQNQQQQQPPPEFSFRRNLKFGDSGEDVRKLQQILIKEGCLKPGLATGWFGSLTFRGVVCFQTKYASEILLPIGLKIGTGVVGPLTRAKLNKLLKLK